MSDVVNNVAEGRKNDNERILAYSIGIAISNVYFAADIYKTIADKGVTMDIDIKNPTTKFWIQKQSTSLEL
ncbi:MAG: hypothetical protein AB9880_07805 [Christensenellales bacterium]